MKGVIRVALRRGHPSIEGRSVIRCKRDSFGELLWQVRVCDEPPTKADDIRRAGLQLRNGIFPVEASGSQEQDVAL